MALGGNIRRGGAALLTVAAIAVAAAGCGGGEATSGPVESADPSAGAAAPARMLSLADAVTRVREQLDGIPQRKLVLGSSTAPIQIVEYASLECSACADLHETVVPEVIERYVRTGEANLEFRTLTASAASVELARGAFGAAPQNRAWHVIQLGYLRSQVDRDAPLAAVETPSTRANALELDVPRWRRDAGRKQWTVDIQAALSVYRVARWTGAPVFLVRRFGSDGPYVVLMEPSTLDAFVSAIEEAERG